MGRVWGWGPWRGGILSRVGLLVIAACCLTAASGSGVVSLPAYCCYFFSGAEQAHDVAGAIRNLETALQTLTTK